MIETKRLLLRRFRSSEEDMNALYQILSDKEVNTYLPWFPVENHEQAIAFYNQRILKKYETEEGFYFAVCRKEEDLPIGYVVVSGDESRDFGYGLRKVFWNQGIITEAAAAVIDFLRESGWKYVTATHDRKNSASGEVMKKLGMTYRYSYEEQWQPKDIPVIFRMYQLNFDGSDWTYQAYWDKYPGHSVEELE